MLSLSYIQQSLFSHCAYLHMSVHVNPFFLYLLQFVLHPVLQWHALNSIIANNAS